ncbi:uncharacterized protein PFL1_06202 [Pseudozyma flocculosa PF-1]|uniref:Uncharacterized protein n=1 Tax=Pseudozyma flocculosa PF-1 TaxID=1277687 RepID=A0A061H162_9BASI|nr:uncharacterized protein PFL1_06202 [Pseudozyma flocculosa PF-1]EPQ26267.1 hypothetical protein PFL1_06202 [Pseudozyma flocculosa PF-1]
MFPYLQGGPRMMQSYPGMSQSQQGARPTPQTPGIAGAGSDGASGQQGGYLNSARSPGGASGFPFGASAGSGTTPGAGGLASQLNSLGGGQAGQGQGQGQGGQLDLSDFPALGSGQQGGQGQNQGGAPGLAGFGALSGSGNPLSSYASQAGTGGLTAALRAGAPPGSFSQDDSRH